MLETGPRRHTNTDPSLRVHFTLHTAACINKPLDHNQAVSSDQRRLQQPQKIYKYWSGIFLSGLTIIANWRVVSCGVSWGVCRQKVFVAVTSLTGRVKVGLKTQVVRPVCWICSSLRGGGDRVVEETGKESTTVQCQE